MRQDRSSRCCRRLRAGDRYGRLLAAAAILAVADLIPSASLADEGGVSFWLPGFFGSLSALPVQPGMSLGTFFYNTSVRAGSDVATAREITIGRFNPTVNLGASLTLSNDTPIGWINPTYVFASPVLGGQLSVGMGGLVGASRTTVSGTVTASVPPFTFIRTDSITDSVAGVGDLYPQVGLKWHQGVDNFMIYGTGDIPVGNYNSSSLANLGIGHGAADAGVGYTYLDEKFGHEFSAVAGFTYNLINTSTNYQNGVDFHVDWGASQYLSKQLFIGVVGYLYDQVSADSGSGDRVGSFESRVVGVGPQVGYLFPVGDLQGYLNLKAYGEFDPHARASGVNVWLTFAISPAAPTSMSSAPMHHK
jgi:hypothetical protein